MLGAGIIIAGIGHSIPPNIVTNRDLEARIRTSDQFIVSRTGVRERRFADPSQATSDLMEPAALEAIQNAGLRVEDIDMLIVNTLSPDHHDPSQACLMQRRLRLRQIPAFDIRAQCSGLLYGMDIARGFLETERCRNVLVICGELLSKRLDCSDEGRNISVLLGDGAGALVLSRTDHEAPRGLIDLITRADGVGFDMVFTAAPGTRNATFVATDDIDAGRHQFRMRGKPLAAHAAACMSNIALEILEKNGVRAGDVDLVVAHQANLRILENVVRGIGIPLQRWAITGDRLGNMASASLPVTLSMAAQEGRLGPGRVVLLLGYGGGATWGAALYRC
jgi:3-oxoacyl-(acyl-carrier-protein) synthase III